jgi:eukaryotic-like serine/threonine-protein kinase
MVDTTMGRYKILGKLGEGGMAEVHMAEDGLLHRCVAVKTLRASGLRNPDLVLRFQQEATTVSRLGHANIVQVFDLGTRLDGDYLVMEFLDRGSISRIVSGAGGKLDPICAACVAVQAAEGLSAAHEAGVVHRDVKPDNLLVSRQGVVKVADFGIARLQSDVSHTEPGTTLGSPHYMAPEQVEGEVPTGRTDVFALASVLHFLISGKPAFEAENAIGLMWRIAKHDAPELRATIPSCPRALSDLVRTMHARESGKRPEMTEVADRLRAWLAEQGILHPSEHLRQTLGFPQTSPIASGASTTSRIVLRKNRRLRLLWLAGAAIASLLTYLGIRHR